MAGLEIFNKQVKPKRGDSINMDTEEMGQYATADDLNHDHMKFERDNVMLYSPSRQEQDEETVLDELRDQESHMKTYNHNDELDFNFKQTRTCCLWTDKIPAHKLYRGETAAVYVLSSIQITAGTLAVVLGVVLTGFLSLNSVTHAAPLWWPGIAFFGVGIVGVISGVTGNRKLVLVWGAVSLGTLCLVAGVMAAVGNFRLAQYEVWPVHLTRYRGHPLCQVMVGRCYCQDYFQSGGVKPTVTSGSGGGGQPQYIHEDVVWVETGFTFCEEVTGVSALYFAALGCLALAAAASVAGAGAAAKLTVCAKQGLERFYPLEEAGYDEPFDETNNETPNVVSQTVGAHHDREHTSNV